jgi:hypothetical protein
MHDVDDVRRQRPSAGGLGYGNSMVPSCGRAAATREERPAAVDEGPVSVAAEPARRASIRASADARFYLRIVFGCSKLVFGTR